MNATIRLLAIGGAGIVTAGATGQTIAFDSFGPGNEYNPASGWFVRGPNHASTSPDWTQGWLFQAGATGGITEMLVL